MSEKRPFRWSEHIIDLVGLKTDWDSIVLESSPRVDPVVTQRCLSDLVVRYSEPHRYYHGILHVQDLLRLAYRFQDRLQDFGAVRFAVWFHDAIYEPEAADNEEKSAAYAWERMQMLGIPEPTIDKVAAYVLATKTHSLPDLSDADLPYFLDFDLGILGSDPERYGLYTQEVRQEYAHMPDKENRVRRMSFLENMLQRERIFITHEMSALETQARTNMGRELEALAQA